MNESELEAFCGAWPGVTVLASREDEFVLSVAGRAFATLCLRGPERGRISFAVEASRFVELTARPDIVPAHYTARPFWITLTEPERVARDALGTFVRHSYELVRAGLSRRHQAQLAALESAAPKPRAPHKHKA